MDKDNNCYDSCGLFPHTFFSCHPIARRPTRIAFLPIAEKPWMLTTGTDNKLSLWKPDDSQPTQFRAHNDTIWALGCDPQATRFATAGDDGMLQLWHWQQQSCDEDAKTITITQGDSFELRHLMPNALVFTSDNKIALACEDGTVAFIDLREGKLTENATAHEGGAITLTTFTGSEGKQYIATGGQDDSLAIWQTPKVGVRHCRPLLRLRTKQDAVVSLAEDPASGLLATGGTDGSIKLWDARKRLQIRLLEGHAGRIDQLVFSHDGAYLASRSADQSLQLWATHNWQPITRMPLPMEGLAWLPALAFHPARNWLATAYYVTNKKHKTKPSYSKANGHYRADILNLETSEVLAASTGRKTVHYRNAKVLLVGDIKVGKTQLAHRLVHDDFKPCGTTHAREAHLLSTEEVTTAEGQKERREIILWDLAGQPTFHLIHQLSMDQAALACVLMDARNDDDPFASVRYWVQLLDQAESSRHIERLLVPTQVDVTQLPASREQLDQFASEHGFTQVIPTSAYDGTGSAELRDIIKALIPWELLTPVSSSRTLETVRLFFTKLKAAGDAVPPLLTIAACYARLRNATQLRIEMETFIGYLRRLKDADLIDILAHPGLGAIPNTETLVLLDPTRVDAFASAILLAAKSSPNIPGALAEADILDGKIRMPSREHLSSRSAERPLLEYVLQMLYRKELALREMIDGQATAIFPSQCTGSLLLTERSPVAITFAFGGNSSNLFTTLCVRLAYYKAFQGHTIYRNGASYQTDKGRIYLHLKSRTDGTAEMELSFDASTPQKLQRGLLQFARKHFEDRAAPGTVKCWHSFRCSNEACGKAFPSDALQHRIKARMPDIPCYYCNTLTPLPNLLGPPSQSATAIAEDITENAKAGKQETSASCMLNIKKQRKQYDIFLCYNSADAEYVEAIAEQLKARGFRCWLDSWAIAASESIPMLVHEAIRQAVCATVCHGAHGLSKWQKHECDLILKRAIQDDLRYFATLLPDSEDPSQLEDWLSLRRWVDLRDFGQPRSTGMTALEYAIVGRRFEPGAQPLQNEDIYASTVEPLEES